MPVSEHKKVTRETGNDCKSKVRGREYVGDRYGTLKLFIIKFPYHARFDWLKQRTLSENKVQVNDIKLASKFLFRNFDKFDPN